MKKYVWILTSYPPDSEESIDRNTMVCEGTSGGQYENIKLLDEFRNLDFDVKIVNPEKIQKSIIMKNIDIPDIAIVRITQGACIPNLRLLTNLNIRLVNSLDTHLICANKPKQLDMLYEHAVDIPKTKIINLPFNDSDLDQLDYPVVVKPISSMRGELVDLCKTPEDVYIHCKKIQIRFPNQKSVIVQELISGPTISVWVIGGNAVSAQIRYPKPGINFFVSNRRDDGLRSEYQLNGDLCNLITNASKALNIELARIDVLKSYDGYKICEVNSPGGFSARDKSFNDNHARDTALYIRGLL